MQNNNLLADDFTKPVEVLEGYEEFFTGLLEIVNKGDVNQETGNQIHNYVLDFVKENPLTVDNFNEDSYTRNYIGRDDRTGWEAIVMNWKKGNTTAIHSHPQFASYTFSDGEYLIEVFEKMDDNTAKLKAEVVVNEPKCFFAIGEEKSFDNHIHRITCLSETGHSLHIYSDDALKGKKFEQA